MSRVSLRERFLEELEGLGGGAGNARLREALGWQEETYWRVHEELIGDGTIEAGRGRGGSVALASGKRKEPTSKPSNKTESREAAAEEAAPRQRAQKPASNGSPLGFEEKLWAAADALRNNMDAAEYKHVVLGLIFLKYISDAFEAKHAELEAERAQGADPEDPDEYRAENIFWVPKEARWSHLKANAPQPTIGRLVDDAMMAIERDNESLKGVLPKDFARPGLDKQRLGQLINLVSDIALGSPADRAKDTLGRVYEYFLSRFAGAEGKKGGQFYTPRYVVRVLVEMLAPYKGRVYDPCCGSGGMFVQSEKFIEAHAGKIGDISIYGQESNYTTWRLAKMNLAIRGIDGQIAHGDTFHNDRHPDLKADYILANPHFNDSDWRGELLKDDNRWLYGTPPPSNANFAWVQHFISYLVPRGSAAFVLAIMALSSDNDSESGIRQQIIDADLVESIVTLPGKLFYSTPIPVSVWVISRSKKQVDDFRDRCGKTLFIDASRLGAAEDRTHNFLTDDDVKKIAGTFKAWRSSRYEQTYSDIPGWEADLEMIRSKGHSLFPAAYIEHEGIHIRKKTPSFIDLLNRLRDEFVASRLRQSTILNSLTDYNSSQEHTLSGKLQTFRLSEVLTISDERLGDRKEPEILTCTEGAGLVLQRERFAKRVATDDTSEYKTEYYTDIVYNPYLLWGGAIDQCTVVQFGITSPAYSVFKVRQGFDPFLVGRALKTPRMIHRYDGISVGTIQRRRRAPAEKFLELELKLPPIHEQEMLTSVSLGLFKDISLDRENIRQIESFFRNISEVYSE